MEEPKQLIGGTDYPRTFNALECFFKSEATCRAYLTSMRWPAGYEWSRCGSPHAPWSTERGYLHCRDCGTERSGTAGTIFERTRIPLKTWVLALWFVTSQKHGARALGLTRVRRLGSYQTAWTWVHKWRRAMVRPGRDRLRGHIEVDEPFVGGSNKGGQRGRGAARKAIVLIAVEVQEPKGFGRVRMRCGPDASGKSLMPFVCDNIEPGSTVLTDAWRGDNRVTKPGYTHITTNLSASGEPAHVAMPGVHRIAALLKRWLLGIHQGAASGKHLEYYLDAYTFRLNRRPSASRGLLFSRLMPQAVVTKPVSSRQIICDHDPNM